MCHYRGPDSTRYVPAALPHPPQAHTHHDCSVHILCIVQTKEGEEPKQQELVRPYQSTRQLIDYGSKSTDSAGSLMDDFADEDLRLTLEETAREI
jgi:hypothetical protein